MQVMTLYDSYDEYNIDMDILGKVVSIPQLSRDELKDVVFRELQETHPVPKLEDERYKLSKPVDEDYQIQVENYKQEFEDEDLSVDDLAEGEDPYALGTDSEDLYAVDDIYGLDLNIFSSPFSESEVEQAISDIESFLNQKVEKFKQNKAEYEKRNELSVEEVRAMYSRQAQVKEEPEEIEGTLYEDEEMIDTFSSSEVEVIEDDKEPYFISESDAPYIRVEVINAEDLFVSEPDTPYIEVESGEYFIQEPSIPYIEIKGIEVLFITEPDIPFIESESTIPDADMNEIHSTSINNNAEFFVQEEDISFINVYSSEEESGYEESSDDTDDYTVEEESDDMGYEEESDDDMGYEEESGEGYSSYDESDASEDEEDSYDESEDSEDDEDSYDIDSDEDDEPEGDFDVESDDSEEGYSTESDEEDDYSTESDEEEDSEDYSTESDDGDESDGEGFNIEEDDSDDFSTDQDESEVDFSTDSDDEEVLDIEGTEEEDDTEPVLAPPPQVKKSIKESKGSDTLNPRQVSQGSDLEDSFIDKPLAKGTKLTQSTRDREIKNPPRDLVDFLRLYPRTQYSIAVKYYGEKEVKRQIRIGRVHRNGKYLII